MVNIGLQTLIAKALNDGLPKASVIKELEHNIRKYGQQKISNEDVMRISTRIVDKQLTNSEVEDLNRQAQNSPEEFVQKLNETAQAEKQKEQAMRSGLNELLRSINEVNEKTIQTMDNLERENKLSQGELAIERQNRLDSLTESFNDVKSRISLLHELKIRAEEHAERRTKRIVFFTCLVRLTCRLAFCWIEELCLLHD